MFRRLLSYSKINILGADGLLKFHFIFRNLARILNNLYGRSFWSIPNVLFRRLFQTSVRRGDVIGRSDFIWTCEKNCLRLIIFCFSSSRVNFYCSHLIFVPQLGVGHRFHIRNRLQAGSTIPAGLLCYIRSLPWLYCQWNLFFRSLLYVFKFNRLLLNISTIVAVAMVIRPVVCSRI